MLQAKVLDANGIYVDASRISKGDKVINMAGKIVNVKHVSQRKTTNEDEIVTLRHDNWYNMIKITSSVDIFTKIQKNKLVWQSPTETFEDRWSAIPANIEWQMDPDTPFEQIVHSKFNDVVFPCNQDTGFFLGAFLRLGHLAKKNKIVFYIGSNSDIVVSRLENICMKTFGLIPLIERREFTKDLTIQSPWLWELLKEFGEGKERHLPAKYYCTDIKFAEGVYKGLYYAGTPDEPILSSTPMVSEAFYWAAMMIDKPSHSTQEKAMLPRGEHNLSKYRIYNLRRGYETLVDIYTDCPEGSFIASNVVVRCQ
jgi:hypothetical protein